MSLKLYGSGRWWPALLVAAGLLSRGAGAVADSAIDFDTQIMPIFTQAGCNAGSCHGAATGRGGFKLSLLGSIPAQDFSAIVYALEGRRINLSRPDRSLLLRKPTEDLDHEGGYKLKRGSEAERLLRDWIGQGARRLQARRLKSLNVGPRQTLLDATGREVQLRAVARFDDGSEQDVTTWVTWTAGDEASILVSRHGLVQALRPGQHVVLARYLDQIQAASVTVPLGDADVDLSQAPVHNWIDEHIHEGLTSLRLPPSAPCSDEKFHRRIILDLTGRLPTPQEIEEFAADGRPDRRVHLVERLLESDAHADYWALKLADQFHVDSRRLGAEGAAAFHGWLRAQVAANTPLNQVAAAMLTTTGDSYVHGAANFSRIGADPRLQAELVSQSLLGVRMGCANCHNHPLDRWTQDDYHGLSAALAKVQRGRIVSLADRGEVTHPLTGAPAVPRLPGERFLEPHESGPEELAAWLTLPSNPYFARATVNRTWKQLMGRGLVEPVDDLRDTNPPTHPQLLDALAAEFVSSGFDPRRIIRLIVNSAAYQRSSDPSEENAADDRFYSRALMRPLEAQVLADAISDATGVWDVYAGHVMGKRAVTLSDSRVPSKALEALGRCDRSASCQSPPGTGGLARILYLINGDLVNRKVSAPDGHLHRLIHSGADGPHIVAELYLRTLSRRPARHELDQWLSWTDQGRDAQALEDLFWALLTSREFQTNH